jgi:branched-chain amino acid transport system substrate-binding protein
MTLAASAALVQPMDDKRKWVFKVVPNDDLMAGAIMKIIAKAGVKKLGYIGFSDGYGEGYWKEVSRLAPTVGMEMTTHEVYARSDASVTGQILKIIASKPDAVFIAAAGTPAVLPQKALRERGYAGPIYQTHGIVTEEFLKLGGKDVEGAMFTGEAFTVVNDLAADSPSRKATEAYIAAYKGANGGAAPNMFGAHLWDSIQLVVKAAPAALAKAKAGTPEFRTALRDELEKGKDIYLNNGLSTMSPTDHNGYDDRTPIPIKIEGNQFRLLK